MTLKRKKPMKRTGWLERRRFRRRIGRVGQERMTGNYEAKLYYFRNHGPNAVCQCCGHPFRPDDMRETHHKAQRGEDLTNKQVMHWACHRLFIHDPNRPWIRKQALRSDVDVITGGVIAWGAEARERLAQIIRTSPNCPALAEVDG